MLPTWPSIPPEWEQECFVLLDSSTTQIPAVHLNDIVEKSEDFPIKFPINTMKCSNLLKTAGQDILERNIQSVYPVIHEHSLYLCAKFLNYKRKYGTERERNFYKNISLKDFIHRLLSKRAVTFYGPSDKCLLLDKTNSSKIWETIGTEKEKQPFVLENCISYDEIKLSALLSVSSYTYFINDGNRSNVGNVELDRKKLEKEGIIIGLIGTRFKKVGKMEYEEIIVTPNQNTDDNGYGDSSTPSLHKIFAEFYEEPSILYGSQILTDTNRFTKLNPTSYFDNFTYIKRLALSFDTLLIEANDRARLANKTAYIHVVGIGLGVWKVSKHQTKLFVDTFGERIKFLGKNLKHVSDVHFAYIPEVKDCLGFKHGDIIPIEEHSTRGIQIFISKREPHSTLADKRKLLVVSYAWDGNSLPGNEFWMGMLKSTGDSAAACSTQITELHNPHINPLVCGDNLRVALLDGTVRPIEELVELRKK